MKKSIGDYLVIGAIGIVIGSATVLYASSDSHFDRSVLKPIEDVKVTASVRTREEPVVIKADEIVSSKAGISSVATSSGVVLISTNYMPGQYGIDKIYDYDNDVVCYRTVGGAGNLAISCLHNK